MAKIMYTKRRFATSLIVVAQFACSSFVSWLNFKFYQRRYFRSLSLFLRENVQMLEWIETNQ